MKYTHHILWHKNTYCMYVYAFTEHVLYMNKYVCIRMGSLDMYDHKRGVRILRY